MCTAIRKYIHPRNPFVRIQLFKSAALIIPIIRIWLRWAGWPREARAPISGGGKGETEVSVALLGWDLEGKLTRYFHPTPPHPRLSPTLGCADVCPQRALCLLDQLADAGHHGHGCHGDPECGWKHLREPGRPRGLPRPRSLAAVTRRAGAPGPHSSRSVNRRDVLGTFPKVTKGCCPRGRSLRGCTPCLGWAWGDGLCPAPPTPLGLEGLHPLRDSQNPQMVFTFLHVETGSGVGTACQDPTA